MIVAIGHCWNAGRGLAALSRSPRAGRIVELFAESSFPLASSLFSTDANEGATSGEPYARRRRRRRRRSTWRGAALSSLPPRGGDLAPEPSSATTAAEGDSFGSPEESLSALHFLLRGDNYGTSVCSTLSPYAPVPDPVARRMLELARSGPGDFHVELGSGDGRVVFRAIDPPFSVRRSLGVDIDASLVKAARGRLAEHPNGSAAEFRLADLGDRSHPVWTEIARATVVTMYFLEAALRQIEPSLKKLISENEKCRIVTCGYAIPSWEPKRVEKLMGLELRLYCTREIIESWGETV